MKRGRVRRKIPIRAIRSQGIVTAVGLVSSCAKHNSPCETQSILEKGRASGRCNCCGLVEREIVESISSETVRQTLEKTNLRVRRIHRIARHRGNRSSLNEQNSALPVADRNALSRPHQ